MDPQKNNVFPLPLRLVGIIHYFRHCPVHINNFYLSTALIWRDTIISNICHWVMCDYHTLVYVLISQKLSASPLSEVWCDNVDSKHYTSANTKIILLQVKKQGLSNLCMKSYFQIANLIQKHSDFWKNHVLVISISTLTVHIFLSCCDVMSIGRALFYWFKKVE